MEGRDGREEGIAGRDGRAIDDGSRVQRAGGGDGSWVQSAVRRKRMNGVDEIRCDASRRRGGMNESVGGPDVRHTWQKRRWMQPLAPPRAPLQGIMTETPGRALSKKGIHVYTYLLSFLLTFLLSFCLSYLFCFSLLL